MRPNLKSNTFFSFLIILSVPIMLKTFFTSFFSFLTMRMLFFGWLGGCVGDHNGVCQVGQWRQLPLFSLPQVSSRHGKCLLLFYSFSLPPICWKYSYFTVLCLFIVFTILGSLYTGGHWFAVTVACLKLFQVYWCPVMIMPTLDLHT